MYPSLKRAYFSRPGALSLANARAASEAKSGYFCEGLDCKFGLWRDNKFPAAKRISLTRALATELLDKGRVHLDEIYSQRMDKYYPGDLILHDDGERATYYLSFKGGKS